MKTFWKYLITLLVGFVITGWVLWVKDIFGQTELVKIFHILCDAFTVSGCVLFGVGSLIFVSNEGIFDMMVYGIKSFIDLFGKTNLKKYDTFYDYTVSRASKKLQFGFIMICGAIFLVVAVVMYVLYRQYC